MQRLPIIICDKTPSRSVGLVLEIERKAGLSGYSWQQDYEQRFAREEC